MTPPKPPRPPRSAKLLKWRSAPDRSTNEPLPDLDCLTNCEDLPRSSEPCSTEKITRESAKFIVEDYLRNSQSSGARIKHVYDMHEINFQKPRIYSELPINLEHCWIVYLESPNQPACISSSFIVVISKETGDVIYHGSAGDEG